MEYNELYEALRPVFYSVNDTVVSDELNIAVQKIPFISERCDLLPGSDTSGCAEHQLFLPENHAHYTVYGLSSIDVADFEIACNRSFSYYIFRRADIKNTQEAVILLHGLNEKKWDKYLPWAYELAQQTGKAVILFPIAFHMDRADPDWSDRRKMMQTSVFRTKQFPENSYVSFVNAAISSRLEALPQRIFWSGFQTYSDIIRMISDIQHGNVSGLASSTKFDLFGYSIGAFLSMILKMADPEHLFTHSRLFCFCGGMTMDRMFPISKYIMDSRAAIHMQAVFAELLNSEFQSDLRLAHFQDEHLHPAESWFKKMLRYNHFQKEREDRISEMSADIMAFVLKKDEVATPTEALNTLKGGYRNITTAVDIHDYPFEYSHMIPFPLTHHHRKAVTEAFREMVRTAAEFYVK